MIRLILIALCFTCACKKLQAQVNIITTIGGNGIGVYGDDVHNGGPATNAEIRWPEGLCLDTKGNIYIAESGDNRIRKIDAVTGIITTIGGTGEHGFSGDDGPATDAQLLAPEGVYADTSCNIYIADAGNNRIRKINATTGIITTVTGSGPAGIHTGSASGDGGLATNAQLNDPSGVFLDHSGNIYIADYDNNRIRKVDASNGIITTIAGNGSTVYSGDGLQATNVGIAGAIQVFANSSEDIFFCDQNNHSVRKVTMSTGVITTVAGTGTSGYSGDNGPATKAQLNQPLGIFVDQKNNIFIAEYINGTIRKVDGLTGNISTIAGNGIRGFSGDNGPATNAELKCGDVFLDSYGHIFIADLDNNRIREVYDSATVSTPLVALPEIKVLPNPVHRALTIEHAAGSNVSICNMLGQQMYAAVNISDKEVLHIEALAPGIYVVRIVDREGVAQQVRILKE